jgi:uncharacterized Zn-finger protein
LALQGQIYHDFFRPRFSRGGGGDSEKKSYVSYRLVPENVIDVLKVSCDGGGGALGHPKIFINLDRSGPQACIYCGLRFEMDHSHAHHH